MLIFLCYHYLYILVALIFIRLIIALGNEGGFTAGLILKSIYNKTLRRTTACALCGGAALQQRYLETGEALPFHLFLYSLYMSVQHQAVVASAGGGRRRTALSLSVLMSVMSRCCSRVLHHNPLLLSTLHRQPAGVAFTNTAPTMTFATAAARAKLSRTAGSNRSSRGGAARPGAVGTFGGAQTRAGPSRRRRRTVLGMGLVSDRPFKAPQTEPMEEMSFRQLGLLDELVHAMDEFGEMG